MDDVTVKTNQPVALPFPEEDYDKNGKLKKVRGRVLDEAMRLRVMRSLVSQGFDYDTVKRAMAEYEEETSND